MFIIHSIWWAGERRGSFRLCFRVLSVACIHTRPTRRELTPTAWWCVVMQYICLCHEKTMEFWLSGWEMHSAEQRHGLETNGRSAGRPRCSIAHVNTGKFIKLMPSGPMAILQLLSPPQLDSSGLLLDDYYVYNALSFITADRRVFSRWHLGFNVVAFCCFHLLVLEDCSLASLLCILGASAQCFNCKLSGTTFYYVCPQPSSVNYTHTHTYIRMYIHTYIHTRCAG